MRLPDKEYLTFKELAKRWNCDEVDLFHYVATRKLVPSIFVSGNYESFTIDLIKIEKTEEFGLCSNFIHEYKNGIFFLNLAEHNERRECTFRYFSKERVLGDFSFCNAFKHAINLYLRADDLVYADDNLIFVNEEIVRFESDNIQKTLPPSEKEGLEERLLMEKPLGSRERNNLLKVIAALCKEQNLSLDTPYKAATIIENQIKSIGHSLGSDTIALILSEAEKITKAAKKP